MVDGQESLVALVTNVAAAGSGRETLIFFVRVPRLRVYDHIIVKNPNTSFPKVLPSRPAGVTITFRWRGVAVDKQSGE